MDKTPRQGLSKRWLIVLRFLALAGTLLAAACGHLVRDTPPDTGQPPDTWRPMSMDGAPSPRRFATTTWTGRELVVWGGGSDPTTFPQKMGIYNDGSRYDPRTDRWRPMSTANAPSPRMYATGVWTGRELLVWGGGDLSLPLPFSPAMGGGIYNPVSDTWHPMSPSGLAMRGNSTVVWTGTELLVWGGTMDALGTKPGEWRWYSVSDGARYNPNADSWAPISAIGAPDGARRGIWTGKELLVWSTGEDHTWTPSAPARPGARYDPAKDMWTPMTVVNAPSPYASVAAWTGSELLVWGDPNGEGARYNPATDTWARISTLGAPLAHHPETIIWTGQDLLVWGGCCYPPRSGRGGFANDGGLYNPRTDTWTPIGADGAPASRSSYAAVWTGREFVVWGGCCNPPGKELNDGARYDVAARRWEPLPLAGAPTPRVGPQPVVWTGRELLVWGGNSRAGSLSDGATYRPPDIQR